MVTSYRALLALLKGGAGRIGVLVAVLVSIYPCVCQTVQDSPAAVSQVSATAFEGNPQFHHTKNTPRYDVALAAQRPRNLIIPNRIHHEGISMPDV